VFFFFFFFFALRQTGTTGGRMGCVNHRQGYPWHRSSLTIEHVWFENAGLWDSNHPPKILRALLMQEMGWRGTMEVRSSKVETKIRPGQPSLGGAKKCEENSPLRFFKSSDSAELH
ncbi:hypothetical protein QBC44DRAFT_336057, partial [Cladorrhinum sp. PSN332]